MDFFLGLWSFGPLEIGLVALVALLLFGKRLPEVARSLGKGITEFKKGIKDVGNDVEKGVEKAVEDSGTNADAGKEKSSEG